jgi:hypothetical protein
MKKLSFLDRTALFIVKMVSNMYCAIIFTLLALISLPTAIKGGVGTIVAWTAQTFIQLVLLSIIMVGQDIQNRQADKVSDKHYKTMLKHEEKIDIIDANVDKVLDILNKRV